MFYFFHSHISRKWDKCGFMIFCEVIRVYNGRLSIFERLDSVNLSPFFIFLVSLVYLWILLVWGVTLARLDWEGEAFWLIWISLISLSLHIFLHVCDYSYGYLVRTALWVDSSFMALSLDGVWARASIYK